MRLKIFNPLDLSYIERKKESSSSSPPSGFDGCCTIGIIWISLTAHDIMRRFLLRPLFKASRRRLLIPRFDVYVL